MLRGYGVMFANFRFGTPVRAPAVAGTFYPRSPETLRQTVGNLLAAAEVRQRSQRCGVIAPHAGYTYSGPVAAEAFAGVRGLRGRIARAAVIGPAHFVPFRGIAAPSDTAFATPLGEVPIDIAMVEALSADALVSANDAPHAPEHAIEVELPFLQAIFGDLPIVPLLFGSTSAAAVADAVARVWTDDTLLVVSTDLSHFEDDASARRHDERTAAAIERFDEAAIGSSDACGHLAVRGALIEAARRGLAIERLALRNSGDATGDRDRVVGYGAWAFYAPA
jgi:AmmeMemoRadiSam system protein B